MEFKLFGMKRLRSVLCELLCLAISAGVLFVVLNLSQFLAVKIETPRNVAYGMVVFAIVAHLLSMTQYKLLLPQVEHCDVGIWTVVITWAIFLIVGFAIFLIFLYLVIHFLLTTFDAMGVVALVLGCLLLISFCYIFYCED